MTVDGAWARQIMSWRTSVHELYDRVRGSDDVASAHRAWVAGREAMFERHPASARQTGQRLAHAPYDPAYRFVVPMVPADEREWSPPTGTDGDVPFVRIGRFELAGLGSLDVWWLRSYGNGVFLPLRDSTAGRSSYGAGRYLLDTIKGADLGREGEDWVLDLNFAYNPSCAYAPEWACPLAPPGNRLDAEVPVGELIPLTA